MFNVNSTPCLFWYKPRNLLCWSCWSALLTRYHIPLLLLLDHYLGSRKIRPQQNVPVKFFRYHFSSTEKMSLQIATGTIPSPHSLKTRQSYFNLKWLYKNIYIRVRFIQIEIFQLYRIKILPFFIADEDHSKDLRATVNDPRHQVSPQLSLIVYLSPK